MDGPDPIGVERFQLELYERPRCAARCLAHTRTVGLTSAGMVTDIVTILSLEVVAIELGHLDRAERDPDLVLDHQLCELRPVDQHNPFD